MFHYGFRNILAYRFGQVFLSFDSRDTCKHRSSDAKYEQTAGLLDNKIVLSTEKNHR